MIMFSSRQLAWMAASIQPTERKTVDCQQKQQLKQEKKKNYSSYYCMLYTNARIYFHLWLCIGTHTHTEAHSSDTGFISFSFSTKTPSKPKTPHRKWGTLFIEHSGKREWMREWMASHSFKTKSILRFDGFRLSLKSYYRQTNCLCDVKRARIAYAQQPLVRMRLCGCSYLTVMRINPSSNSHAHTHKHTNSSYIAVNAMQCAANDT